MTSAFFMGHSYKEDTVHLVSLVPSSSIRWNKIRAVIFDVDGTLYAQSKLRTKMLAALARYYAVRPWRLQEVLILQRFRAEREKRHGAAGPDLENAQYTWVTRDGKPSVEKVRQVVEQWIFREPNQYLSACTYPGAKSFFALLRQQGIKIGIYSDYKAHDKLAAMGLSADLIVSSTDPYINHFKPAPHGLFYIAESLGLAVDECLFIGDRPELDGACARQAGMPYLIVDKQPYDCFTFYQNLEKELLVNQQLTNHE